MPHNLIRLSLRAVDPQPCSDSSSARGGFGSKGDDDSVAPEAKDAVERQWLQRISQILDAPGETTSDACQVTPYLWLGGRRAAEDVFYANTRGITDMLNVCEPWCAMGPNSNAVRYCGVEALDRRSFPILDDAYYGVIRRYVNDARIDRPDAVFLLHCDRGVNRSAAVASAYLMDEANMTLIETVRLLKERRGCVLGNVGFRAALVKHARRLGRLGGVDDNDE